MSSSQNPSKLAAWYAATRPRVFVASFVPMGIAAILAVQDGVFKPFYFILALIGVMLLQTTANLVNEYMDYVRGSDELKQAGQSMTLKNKLLTVDEIRNGAIVVTVLACLIGLYLLSQSGLWLLGIGLGGVLIAVMYTAGPYPLAYHGLGEVAAGIFMGPMIVLGAYYVMNPALSSQKLLDIWLISLPIMFTTAAILHANNIRDLDADRAANKNTLAVRFGIDGARLEYKLLIGATYFSQVLLILMGLLPPSTLITALTIPSALSLIQTFDTETDVQKLHIAQGRTAQLHGQVGLLIVLAWAAWLIILSFTTANS